MFAAPAAVPPMRVVRRAEEERRYPRSELPMGWVPVISVPIRFPSIRLYECAVEDQDDPVAAVAREHVARAGGRPADRVVVPVDVDAVAVVGNDRGPVPVTFGAHQVALNHVVVAAAVDLDGIAVVARDQVSGSPARPPTVLSEELLTNSRPMPLGRRLVPVASVPM